LALIYEQLLLSAKAKAGNRVQQTLERLKQCNELGVCLQPGNPFIPPYPLSDVERYREANGHYPPSLLSVWQDYKPAVKGVEQYHYEPNGDAYNLYFEHLASQLGTREIVMYNKRDEHQMTSHAMDLLLLKPPGLAVQRGY